MKTNKILFTLLIAATLIGNSHAVVLLETYFAGTGSNVSGGTLSGFDYTTSNGLTGGQYLPHFRKLVHAQSK